MHKKILVIALSGVLLNNFAGAMDKNNEPLNSNALQKQDVLKKKETVLAIAQKQAAANQKSPQKIQPNISIYSCFSSQMLLLKNLDAIG